MVLGHYNLGYIETLNTSGLLAVIGTLHVQQHDDGSLQGREQSVFERALRVDLEHVVEVDVVDRLIHWYLLTRRLVLASFPPDLHAAGKINIDRETLQLQLELVVELTLHYRFKLLLLSHIRHLIASQCRWQSRCFLAGILLNNTHNPTI
jgi:hypothetical protein